MSIDVKETLIYKIVYKGKTILNLIISNTGASIHA